MAASSVRIYEVGPRDGLQNEASILPTAAKAELVGRLAAAGLSDVEVTSFVRPRWIPQLADAQDLVPRLPKGTGATWWGLVPNRTGLERALECGLRNVATFMSASETHNKKNVNHTLRESLAGIEEVVQIAHDEGVRVRAYISTVFGCPYEGAVAPEATLHLAERHLAAGAEQIVLGDTIGVANPAQVERMIALLDAHGIGVDKLAVHFHDTRGAALVNAYAAWQCGITTFDASVAGLGGCPYAPGASGNLATEDLVYMFDGMGVSTGVSLPALADTGVWVSDALGRELPGRFHGAWRGARQRSQSAG